MHECSWEAQTGRRAFSHQYQSLFALFHLYFSACSKGCLCGRFVFFCFVFQAFTLTNKYILEWVLIRPHHMKVRYQTPEIIMNYHQTNECLLMNEHSQFLHVLWWFNTLIRFWKPTTHGSDFEGCCAANCSCTNAALCPRVSNLHCWGMLHLLPSNYKPKLEICYSAAGRENYSPMKTPLNLLDPDLSLEVAKDPVIISWHIHLLKMPGIEIDIKMDSLLAHSPSCHQDLWKVVFAYSWWWTNKW